MCAIEKLFVYCLPILLFTMSLYAETVLQEDDFESYTVPEIPTNPSDNSPEDWYFSPHYEVSTVLDNSPGGWGGNERVLKIQREPRKGYDVVGRKFEPQVSGILKIELKFQTHNTWSDTDSNYFSLIHDNDELNTYAGVTTPISLRMSKNNMGIQYRTEASEAGELKTTWNPLGATLRADTWYQLIIEAHLDEKTFNVTVIDLEKGTSGSTLELTKKLFFLTDTSELNAWILRPSNTNIEQSIDWTINDVKVTHITP